VTGARSSARLAAEYLVVGTVCLLPWLFGGVESWAWRGASIPLVIGSAVWIAFGGGSEQLVNRRPLWLAPAVLLCAWAFLQTVPLPVGVLGAASPVARDRIARALPGFGDPTASDLAPGLRREALAALPGDLPEAPAGGIALEIPGRAPRWHAVSIAPAMTAECAAWYVALLAAALVVDARAASREARQRMRAALFVNFALLAAVGLLQKATWNGAVLWIRPVEGGRPFGPYVNGIHFAGMMEMGLPWMAAYAAGRWRSRRGSVDPRAVAIGLAAGSMFLAGLAAQSKMAAALMAVGASVLTFTVFDGAARTRAALTVGLAWVLGAAAVLLTPLGERFRELGSVGAAGIGDYERIVAWKSMLPALRDFWLCGAGYGSFRYLAPAYLPGGDGYGWLQLHNDWLESALSGGSIGSVLLVAVAATWVVAIAARARRLESRGARLEQIGMAIGLASLTVHAAVDFNHQIPANALTFVAIAAFAASGSSKGATEMR
jgi:hypothetical protein